MARIKDFMAFNEVQIETFEIDESSLKMEAVTKEVRQELLEAFFRRVFAEVYFWIRFFKPLTRVLLLYTTFRLVFDLITA